MSQVAIQGSKYQAESAVPHMREDEAERQVPRGKEPPQVPSLCVLGTGSSFSVCYLTGPSLILNITGSALLGFLQNARLCGRFTASKGDPLKGLPAIEWPVRLKVQFNTGYFL